MNQDKIRIVYTDNVEEVSRLKRENYRLRELLFNQKVDNFDRKLIGIIVNILVSSVIATLTYFALSK